MKRPMLRNWFKVKRVAILLFLLPLAVMLTPAFADSSINPSIRYAYSANSGWIDAGGDTTNGLVVHDLFLEGYMYGANIGWIFMGDGSPTNNWSYSNTATDDCGVNIDDAGNLYGYAYGANVGWIQFESEGAPEIDRITGALSGYAYGANIGWISLSNAVANGCVVTDCLEPGVDKDGDGIPDAWEYMRVGDITTLGGGDHDGDGAPDDDEYVSDTDPDSDADMLALDHAHHPQDQRIDLLWNTRPTRTYRLEYAGNLDGGTNWQDIGMGEMRPDETWKKQYQDSTKFLDRRLYRVQAVRPLAP